VNHPPIPPSTRSGFRFSRFPWLGLIGLVGAILQITGCQNAAPVGREAAIDHYVGAMLLYHNGNPDKAITALQIAVKEHEQLVMPHIMLGDLYRSKQNYAGAMEQYEKVIKLDPYAAENHYKLGLVYQLVNRLEDAAFSYLRAIKLDPKDFNSNMNLGAVYLALGKPEDALPYAQKATELNAKSAPATSNLGVIYDTLKMYKSAEDSYRKALELDGNQTQTAFYLAENLMKQGKYQEARSVMGQIVLRDDSPRARKRFGDAMFMSKQYDDALTQYENALKLDPRFYPAMNEEGWVLITQYSQGLGLDEPKRMAAIGLWQHSLQLNPDQPKIAALIKQYGEKFAE
jgi:tetratricopeptide (TPR) repeat protein